MGIPTISVRKHYRLVPGEAEEPTSTIVLTSKDSYFVDVRLLREEYEKEKDKEINNLECIDWAFAGRSHTKPQGSRENGQIKLSHTTWEHWIDSRSNDPAVDEGDMWVQKNGDVLERGKQKDPDTGEETEYEELWHDLEVIPLGKKQNRQSLVMKADDVEKDIRGMAVKIGGWCQAILKVEGELTVERWERRLTKPDGDDTIIQGYPDEERTRNDFVRTFRFGKGKLPCQFMCANSSGKIGLNTTCGYQIDSERQDEVEWRVVEEYYW